jgi:hypothetical protein
MVRGGTLIAVVVALGCAFPEAALAAGSHAPTAAEARALRAAEAHRHHPRGTKLLAMRVAGPGGDLAAVIWRAPVTKTALLAAAPKIVNVHGGTDYYSGGPRHYEPAKPNKKLRPRYYDIKAIAEGKGSATRHVPGASGPHGCESPDIALTASSREDFMLTADDVNLITGRTGKVKSTYDAYSKADQKTSACGSQPASEAYCAYGLGLTKKGENDPTNLTLDGFSVSAFPAALLDQSEYTFQNCESSLSGARLVLSFLGGTVTLPGDGVRNGFGIELRLGLSDAVKPQLGHRSCSSDTCGSPPDCADSGGGTGGVTITCSADYNAAARVEAFPSRF